MPRTNLLPAQYFPPKNIFKIENPKFQKPLQQISFIIPPGPLTTKQVASTKCGETRQQKIERYRLKRNKRRWKNEISYASRKELAEKRMRYYGRFASKKQVMILKNKESAIKSVADEEIPRANNTLTVISRPIFGFVRTLK